ncbi:MAG: hypothetical protein ACE5MM_07870, partial [Nitrospiraceae bacterium]
MRPREARPRWGWLFLSLLLSACVIIPKHHTKGRLAEQTISTTTDSTLSKYYLEHYLRDEHIIPHYDQKIDRAIKTWSERPLDSVTLRKITEEFSTDFATLYLVSRLYQDPINRRAQQAFHSHLDAIRNKGFSEVSRVAQRF